MPQADLFYTSDQDITPEDILRRVEEIILAMDASAGFCKGRAHKISEFHHSHILLQVSMLPKKHRDSDFTDHLGKSLSSLLKTETNTPAPINVHIKLDLDNYF